MPTAAADLELMRAALLMDTDPSAAARAAAGLLAAHPEHEGTVLLLATACRRIGDPATAVRVLTPLVAGNPSSAAMLFELGRAQAAELEGAEALASLERVVTIAPQFADAWRELSRLRFRMGDEPGCDRAYLEYARLTTDPPALADAAVAIAENRLDAAEAMLKGRLASVPHDVHALRMLAEVASEAQDPSTAERLLRDCLTLEPGYGAARYDLARVLNSIQRSDEALALLDRLLATEPSSRAFLALKAQVLRFVERNAEAVALMEQVVADDPADASALIIFGALLLDLGDSARAIDAYRRAIRIAPAAGEAWWGLANLKTFRFTTAEIDALRLALASAPALGAVRASLEFALAKALEDSEQYEESFRHYARGNALVRGTINYDPAPMDEDVRRCEETLTPRLFAERSGWGLAARDPIFIVGVPRSGSTLVEQILSSHSQIEGTRELVYLTQVVRELADCADRRGDDPYPAFLDTLSRGEIEAGAARYLELASKHRLRRRPFFVDKMLNNFAHVGLIHMMFPNATILDVRRHPLACGFSCYKQLFAPSLAFTFNLGEMGLYWRAYHDLMAHTDSVLPGRVCRVHYERLVAEPESEVRRILDRCGLPFEEQCLRFHENERKVMTVSSQQVRQPLYASAVDHWRNFEPWLGPLAEALGPLVAEYPTFTSVTR